MDAGHRTAGAVAVRRRADATARRAVEPRERWVQAAAVHGARHPEPRFAHRRQLRDRAGWRDRLPLPYAGRVGRRAGTALERPRVAVADGAEGSAGGRGALLVLRRDAAAPRR